MDGEGAQQEGVMRERKAGAERGAADLFCVPAERVRACLIGTSRIVGLYAGYSVCNVRLSECRGGAVEVRERERAQEN